MTWHKYSAKKTEHAGRSFASKGEASCYDYLCWLERAGEIREISQQASVYLTRARILYRPDFKFFDLKLNETVWAEFKGFSTPVWAIKRRLWQYYGPGLLRVFKGRGLKMELVEEIVPKEKHEKEIP